ncbi:MAG: hypothetical protein CMG07_00155 [Candidatus Marinimicrobia bacterium]|nr:hypothetical protein [Candidatus Neomarinimicrobiota bacterium]
MNKFIISFNNSKSSDKKSIFRKFVYFTISLLFLTIILYVGFYVLLFLIIFFGVKYCINFLKNL